MSRDLLVAVAAGLGGMLGWGTADFFAKKAIDQIGDIVALIWAHLAGSAVLLILLATTPGWSVSLPASGQEWLGIGFFGALQGAVYLFVYIGFGKGQVSLLNPLFASFSGFVALISILFLRERVGGATVATLVLLFTGILLVSTDATALGRRQLKFASIAGLPEISTATALAVVWTIGWNAFVTGKDGLSFAVWMYFAMTLALVGYGLARGIALRIPLSSVWVALFLIGLCEAGGYVAISIGYASTNHTSIVALLSGAFSLPTLLLARIFLRERVSGVQTIGSVAILVAVMLFAVT